jgi:2-haloacid dehalogenase
MALGAISLVAFDVNGTLSDMSAMTDRFAELNAPPEMAELWFAQVLRDGFALTAAGSKERFSVLAEDGLRRVLGDVELNRPIDHAVRYALDGFSSLGVHPDVVEGVRALRAGGLRLVTLTNGSVEVAERLLTTAGIRAEFEMLLSVDDADAWKPARSAYAYAAKQSGVPLGQTLLVAVHPWDIDGAARAGMVTAWVNRAGAEYPSYFVRPTITAASLVTLAAELRGLGT